MNQLMRQLLKKTKRVKKGAIISLFIPTFIIGGYLIYSSMAATGLTCSSVTQYEITYTFDKSYRCGQFVNGDWWVAPDSAGGNVVVNSISPDYVDGENGWEVNPAATTKNDKGEDVMDEQGFDSDVPRFNASLVKTLPYAASANQSLVKTTTTPEVSCPNNNSCVQKAVALTVLGSPPPDGTGAGYFRPPYAGTEKPLIPSTQLRTDLLPSLAPPAGFNMDSLTLAGAAGSISKLQLDIDRGLPNRNLHPRDHMPNYGADVAVQINNAIGRLMLNDPLPQKMPLLINAVQMGIDRYYAVPLGQTWSDGGPGHNMGRKLSILFAVTMIDDPAMKTKVKTDPAYLRFHEDLGLKMGKTGEYLYGGFPQFTYSEARYWKYMQDIAAGIDLNNAEFADPYGYVDGGNRNTGAINSYQHCCISQPWKGSAMIMNLMPSMKEIWQNNDSLLKYTDRWVERGAHFQPDPCAPVNAAEGWGSDGAGGCKKDKDWDTTTNTCKPNAVCGRFPNLHGAHKDGTHRGSAIISALWKAYRGPIDSVGVLAGDINSDKTVNLMDLSALLFDYGKPKAQAANQKCDVNNDGSINILDLSQLLQSYGKSL